ncbi:MAG: hypothetical protein U5K31_12890 [Balneolaceae bacterium]|nr:hypothetical protein [Balneolaceae bacterium]
MTPSDNPKKSTAGRIRTWLGGLLALLLFLALAAWVVNTAVVEPMLRERLADELDALLGEGTTVDREALRVEVDLAGGAVEIRNLSLRPDTAAAPSTSDAEDSARMLPDFSAFTDDPLRQLWLHCGRIRLAGIGPADLAGAASASPADLLKGRTLTLSCTSLRWEPPGQPYRLAAASLRYATSEGVFRADSLRLVPRFDEGEFARRVGVETDRIDLLLPRLELQEVDQPALVSGEGLRARILRIDGMRLEVLRDKRLPGGQPRVKPLPATRLRHLGIPLEVDSLYVSAEEISYAEHRNLVDVPGRIRFTQVEARGGALSTLSPADLVLDLSARFMGVAPVEASAHFPVDSEQASHRLHGSVGALAMEAFNPQMQRLAFVRVHSGTLHRLDFNMTLDRQRSSGEVVMDYEGLSVEVMDRAHPDAAEGRALKSLLVNTLLVRANNHEAPLRRGEVNFERLEEKSVFNYWWKSLLSGILDSIGL